MSTTLAPVNRLLCKDVEWKWTEVEQKAFEDSKKSLTSSSLLVHFDPSLKLILACDASAYGVGTVLAHRMPDGSEKPASHSLSRAERNYSPLEREGLACVFGVKRFHSYLFGHPFELLTDNQPLTTLLNECRATSPQASAHIKRWFLFLENYEYTIRFRKTQAHGNADALSRLPRPTAPPMPAELVLLTEHLEDSPVTAQRIRLWTRRDPMLSVIQNYVRHGWPDKVDSKFTAFTMEELSLHQDCILWGNQW